MLKGPTGGDDDARVGVAEQVNELLDNLIVVEVGEAASGFAADIGGGVAADGVEESGSRARTRAVREDFHGIPPDQGVGVHGKLKSEGLGGLLILPIK